MKANELREMQTAELTSKLADLKAELFNLRFQHAINQLENPGRIEAVKKDIARVIPFWLRSSKEVKRWKNVI